jgi:hypothetical protein
MKYLLDMSFIEKNTTHPIQVGLEFEPMLVFWFCYDLGF